MRPPCSTAAPRGPANGVTPFGRYAQGGGPAGQLRQGPDALRCRQAATKAVMAASVAVQTRAVSARAADTAAPSPARSEASRPAKWA